MKAEKVEFRSQEWRGYLLQTKQNRLTLQEFFRLSNFLRSMVVGVLQGGWHILKLKLKPLEA